MKSRPNAICLLVLAFVAACAHRPGESGFPTSEALAELGETAPPPTAELFDKAAKSVERWTLTGPLPDSFGYEPQSYDDAWGKELESVARSRPGLLLLPASMHCLAREAARFVLANDAPPDDGLRSFMAGRCGVPHSGVATAWIHVAAPEGVADEAIAERLRVQYQELVSRAVRSGTLDAGVSFERAHGQAVVVLAYARRRAHLEAAPMRPINGEVLLEGELLSNAEQVQAVATQGQYGFAHCKTDSGTKLPRFRIRCAADPNDAAMWIQVMERQPGRVLSSAALEILARPSGVALSEYLAPVPTSVSYSGSFESGVLASVNEVRQAAGMGPLALSFEQSQLAARLAPHYFAASLGLVSETVADKVVLGLIAGWRVDGLVRSGAFTASLAKGKVSPGVLLAHALARPVVREALLDPRTSQIAVGSLLGSNGTAAIFTSYQLFEKDRGDSLAVRVRSQLATAREASGAGLPTLLPSAGGADAVRMLEDGKLEPEEALERFMEHTSEVAQVALRGWVAEVPTLDGLKFPPELLMQHGLRVAVAVGVRRPEGAPWGRYCVLIVFADSGSLALRHSVRDGESLARVRAGAHGDALASAGP